MKMTAEILTDLTNLILNPGTRDWERTQLVSAKESGNVEQLEWVLRPHALRETLSPDMTDFYRFLTSSVKFDKHERMEDLTMTQERAIFAGGCFWCMVQPFEERPGILSVTSGYTGGHVENPTYEQVCSHTTGHTEAVEIIFDDTQVTYRELVDLYWTLTDPTDAFGQFEDRGDNYRPVIFVENEVQRTVAEASKAALEAREKFKSPIVTTIEDAKTFWPAEEYHQDFYKKNPERYKLSSATRHRFLKKTWKKESDA
ncbi:MAG: peptide-methionine (S)-S-oxide reductase MsrA [Streptococcaceae bacterium]|jgi:peptide-methionine (S)-S-oxide reductase|nr:peptide-methionine (S)-S-oxide reductase MsrA [Streptococcaceae bacterium]